MTHRTLLLFALLYSLSGWTSDHGVILLYHHVSEQTPAVTSVTPARFREHLDYLEEQDFSVVSLSGMLDALYSDKALPPRAVAITFDDAYLSVYTEAWPELRKRNMPFTVFVSTEAVDAGYASTMSWQQMQAMSPALAEYGAHSVSHDHLVLRRTGETRDQWLQRVAGDIGESIERLEQALGIRVQSFAYPYGEYVAELTDILKQHHVYGLAQHSGAVDASLPKEQLPRFPMSQGYDDMSRFATAVNSRPLPILNRGMDSELVGAGQAPRSLLLELGDGPFRLSAIACYSASGEALALSLNDRHLEIALPRFGKGRNKINCTAPSTERSGEFFWYSRLWIVP